MNDLFRPFLRQFVLVFFDDILVYSKTMDQHYNHLLTTLELLSSHQFFAKITKCCFGQQQSWPIPSTVKEVRGFLGLTGYYRRFVHNYGIIARPLTDLTKKDGFKWTEEATLAFESLKHILMTAPVLRLPNFAQPFIVECDASSAVVGAILIQDNHPVAYFSKRFSVNNKLKSAYDRELLALVLAVQKWNHYLLGRHFFVKTDHYTLKFLLEQRVATVEQQRLLVKLIPYDFSIIHKAGKENTGADALSRRPMTSELLALIVPYCVDYKEIQDGLLQDPHRPILLLLSPICQLIHLLIRGTLWLDSHYCTKAALSFLLFLPFVTKSYSNPIRPLLRDMVASSKPINELLLRTLSFGQNFLENEYKLSPSDGWSDGSSQPLP
ncbi:hypothetical protein E3N88_23324 [Mikania micrantha]|uniref:Reverse transcriptase/retrotransposon-derived protein RNase H-like domain-containing protein n=1 Tax=Mikania micrantha TaxID=192012 RepID=A0A5N6NEF3_9ASTR|nr:hypothetical protein E3N88_23324 [Mikania micrantha]